MLKCFFKIKIINCKKIYCAVFFSSIALSLASSTAIAQQIQFSPQRNSEIAYSSIASYHSSLSKFQQISSSDSLIDTLVIKKRFWRASGELMLVQVIPWAFNYYVRDAEFAHISWESIKHNLKFSSWEWDDNSFNTNQFAHPYHGSMYFSAFRTNGYSFWQSAPAAFAGSFMWETCGETHPPAQNDFINTSLGGISIGEMTYRFSNLIVNNHQRGFKRQVNEVLAFLVNPMNGFNRILDGRWGRVMGNPADRVPSMLYGTLDAGYRRFSEDINDVFTKGDNEFFVRANIQYGNPYQDFEKPFSNFSLIGELGAADSSTLNNIQINGVLYGKHLKEDDEVNHVLTVTMNYDYIKNSVLQYGAQSFNFKLLSDHMYGEKSDIFTEAGIIGVALGSIPDDYLYYGEGRNYDYGPGAGLLLGFKFNLADRFWWGTNYKGIWFQTLNGNESSFFLNVITTDFRYFVSTQFSLSLNAGYFTQKGYYDDYDDVEKHYPYARIGVGYTIGSK
ncbi:MAG: DUF3943 domain-containing protein [Bacteroidia bacterium]